MDSIITIGVTTCRREFRLADVFRLIPLRAIFPVGANRDAERCRLACRVDLPVWQWICGSDADRGEWPHLPDLPARDRRRVVAAEWPPVVEVDTNVAAGRDY